MLYLNFFFFFTLQEVKLSKKSVIERGLVTETPKAKEVIGEHANYCSINLEKKLFPGDVLGYVTPVRNLQTNKIDNSLTS